MTGIVRYPRDEFEYPARRVEAYPTLGSYLASRTMDELHALIWNHAYQSNIWGSYSGTTYAHSVALAAEFTRREAAAEIEALRIERDARPTQENAFKAIEAARAEERAKCEAEIASLRADCRMKDELLTAAVDDYDKAAKEVAALRTALDEWKGAAFASRLEEREACAALLETIISGWYGKPPIPSMAGEWPKELVRAIRARTKQGVEK